MYRPIITGTQAYGSVMVVFVLLLIFANAEENNALQRYFPYAYIQHISFIFSFVWNASKQYILRIFVFEYCVAWNYWATLEKLNRMFGPKIGHCGVRLEKKTLLYSEQLFNICFSTDRWSNISNKNEIKLVFIEDCCSPLIVDRSRYAGNEEEDTKKKFESEDAACATNWGGHGGISGKCGLNCLGSQTENRWWWPRLNGDRQTRDE